MDNETIFSTGENLGLNINTMWIRITSILKVSMGVTYPDNAKICEKNTTNFMQNIAMFKTLTYTNLFVCEQ